MQYTTMELVDLRHQSSFSMQKQPNHARFCPSWRLSLHTIQFLGSMAFVPRLLTRVVPLVEVEMAK